jgi:microcystin-dependent protein
MACSNCFNGCADTISDQCVKYTGVPIPGLGIATGDSLLVVENQIINKILTLMTGEGIIPIIDPADLCAIVSNYLPVSGDITINQIISALLQSICELETRVADTEGALNTLEADYVITCLSGVDPTSGTHAIVQAAITKLCEVDTALTLLVSNILANYVLISDIDDYIANYISGVPSSTIVNSKMIPFVAVPYFGPLSVFDITGAGIGDWTKIYLCNGQNLTPDLRGRVLVGANTMGSNPYTDGTATNPADGNPSYDGNSPYTKTGANTAFLTSVGQIPLHNHTATLTITDPGHTHSVNVYNYDQEVGSSGSDAYGIKNFTSAVVSTSSKTGLKGNGNDPANPNVVINIGSTGGSSVEGHNNIQPVHSTNYIIYIP